jgi:hypothetical protein
LPALIATPNKKSAALPHDFVSSYTHDADGRQVRQSPSLLHLLLPLPPLHVVDVDSNKTLAGGLQPQCWNKAARSGGGMEEGRGLAENKK